MLAPLVLTPLNHLLRQSGWAPRQLANFAGRIAALQVGRSPALHIAVAANGLFETAASDSGERDVLIALPDDTVARLLTDRQSIFANAQISGSADFAETLASVFRNLRWDAEADLARVVGDILAHRLAAGGKRLLAWQSEAIGRLFGNAAEFVIAEQALLLTASEASANDQLIGELSSHIDTLEQRLRRLEAARH
jgi:ubiquinone biosynthesis protein UbiJ